MAKMMIRQMRPSEFNETTTTEERFFNRYWSTEYESVREMENAYQTKENMILELDSRRDMADACGWCFRVIRMTNNSIACSYTYNTLLEPSKRWLRVMGKGIDLRILIMTECE